MTPLSRSNLCNKITLMSRCFYRELEANTITFLPEGLFDNLINLGWLWVNRSLFSLSNKLKRLSPKEPTGQPEVIRRTQGLKTSNSEDYFIYCCQILLYILLKHCTTIIIWLSLKNCCSLTNSKTPFSCIKTVSHHNP